VLAVLRKYLAVVVIRADPRNWRNNNMIVA
jgi:hypothetical protein